MHIYIILLVCLASHFQSSKSICPNCNVTEWICEGFKAGIQPDRFKACTESNGQHNHAEECSDSAEMHCTEEGLCECVANLSLLQTIASTLITLIIIFGIAWCIILSYFLHMNFAPDIGVLAWLGIVSTPEIDVHGTIEEKVVVDVEDLEESDDEEEEEPQESEEEDNDDDDEEEEEEEPEEEEEEG